MPRRLITSLAALVLVLANVAGARARPFTVHGDSMRPTLSPGDRVDVRSLDERELRRGMLVAARLATRTRPMVKRLVALPGDRLSLDGDRLRVVTPNGASWQVGPGRGRGGGSGALIAQLGRAGHVVPPGRVVLLSDNLAAGHDSRRLGLVPIGQLVGAVTLSAR
jgi:signal peptidase I